jgi:TP901 family phage tail tape measure protein
VAIINGVSKAFKGLVEQTIKVEKVFADINVVLGANQRDLKKFGDGIFRVAKNTAQSFDDVAEGALEFARQGLSMEESLKRINDALILTRLTGLDVTDSVEGLTAAVNTFKKEGITTGEVINKLAELDVKFAVSSADLVKGLQRAGGSAGLARVSFEELAAMIAVVQERTARGGSVIGNALRTIFAKLQGADAISAVEGVGVAVRDLEGNFRSTTTILEELSARMLELDDVTKADILQKVAGKRQIETLIALFADMQSGTSRWGEAIEVVGSNAQTAYNKNIQLNETLDAIVQKTGVSVQQLAARLGELGISDNLKELVSGFNSIIETITGVFDEDSGGKIGAAFISGIGGAILSAPVIGLVLAIIAKLVKDMAAFGVVGLKSLLGLNNAAAQQKNLQDSILQTLMREPAILEEITKKGLTRVQQEQLLLKILQQQSVEYQTLRNLSQSISPAIYKAGARSTSGGISLPTGAGGRLPNAVREEEANIKRGVGGAKPGDRPVILPDFNFGQGKRGPMVVHTGEYLVKDYKGKGSAIFNRDMMDEIGVPKDGTPIGAKGYIPNFVEFSETAYKDFIVAEGTALGKPITARYLGQGNGARNDYNAFFNPQNLKAEALKTKFQNLTPTGFRNLKQGAAQQIALDKKGRGQANFGVLYSDVIGGQVSKNIRTNKGGNTVKAIPVDTAPSNSLYEDVRKSMVQASRKFAATLGFTPDVIDDPTFNRAVDRNLNAGSVESAFGTVFESAFQGALGTKHSSTATWDLPNSASIRNILTKLAKGVDGDDAITLRKTLTEANATKLQAADFKNALNASNLASIDEKIARTRKAAAGFIPNYADPLRDAIDREQGAGIPINQIRINQSGKLMNSQNPSGLAVTNTRDEPTGRIPNFASSNAITIDTAGTRSLATSIKGASAGIKKLGKDADDTGNAMGGSIGSIFALQTIAFGATSALQSFAGDTDSAGTRFAEAMTSVTSSLISLSLISQGGGGLGGLFNKLGGFGSLIAGASKGMSKFIPYIGQALFIFQGLNAVIKGITGQGVLGLFRDATFNASKELDAFSRNLVEAGVKTPEQQKAESDKFFAERALKISGGGKEVSVAQTELKLLQDRLGKAALIFSEKSTDLTKEDGKITTLAPVGNVLLSSSGGTGIEPGQRPGSGQRYAEGTDLGLGFQEIITPRLVLDELANEINDLYNSSLGSIESFVLPNIDKLKAEGADKGEINKFKEFATEQVNQYYEDIGLAVKSGGTQQELLDAVAGALRKLQGNLAENVINTVKDYNELSDEAAVIKNRIPLSIFRAQAGAVFERQELDAQEQTDFGGGGKDGILPIQRELATKQLSEAEKVNLEFAIKRLQLENKIADEQRNIQANLVQQALKGGEIKQIEEGKGALLLEALESGKDFLEVQEMIKELVTDGTLARDSEIAKLLQSAILAKEIANQERRKLGYQEDTKKLEIAPRTFKEGQESFGKSLTKEIDGFAFKMGSEIPDSFRDGLVTALNEANSGAKTLKESLRDAATGFLNMISQAFMRSAVNNLLSAVGFGDGVGFFASGGLVKGGSGTRDDVPAMLTGGEYVIKKDAVKKYGVNYLESLNKNGMPTMADGGFFPIGHRGQGEIGGIKDLERFGNQRVTSGSTDSFTSGRGRASIDLETQSRRLTTFGMRRGSPLQQLLSEQQGQALGLVDQKKEFERQKKAALKAAIISTLVGAGVAFGAQALGGFLNGVKLDGQGASGMGNSVELPFASSEFNASPETFLNFGTGASGRGNSVEAISGGGFSQPFKPSFNNQDSLLGGLPFGAKGGSSNSILGRGGSGSAMLMGGEYVIGGKAVASYGKNFFDSVNNMSAPSPRYALGGGVGTMSPEPSGESSSGETNISITVNRDGNSQVQAQGSNSDGDLRMAEKIKKEVVRVIEEEKRISGALSSRKRGA